MSESGLITEQLYNFITSFCNLAETGSYFMEKVLPGVLVAPADNFTCLLISS